MNLNRRALAGLTFLLMAGPWVMAACGAGPGSAASSTPTLNAAQSMGARLFTIHCSNCHSTLPETIVVGPSLAGIGLRAAERLPGMDAETYLRNSILSPDAYLVDGFQDLMPPALGESLTSEQVDALVAYLLTLR